MALWDLPVECTGVWEVGGGSGPPPPPPPKVRGSTTAIPKDPYFICSESY
jgi:hypothetical protein